MNRYQLDAYTALENVKCQLAAFLRRSFRFRDPKLDEAVHRTIAELGLLAPTVVEATFPHEEATDAPRNLRELAAAGLVHTELPELLANATGDAQWPEDRPLYKHQVESVREYRNGKSLVVSSGTGSGKTEAFLFPGIDTVLRDTDLARPGIRVLIIYPLNALVNNQMERLRAILGHHPTIRFALYTRRLAHTQKEGERKLRNAGQPLYPAEVISREALRAAPPHILVTNFSMLEYALVRPVDAPIFSSSFEHPRLVVLDEAHVYAGAMAAEITLLLRRAWLRWGIKASGDVQGIVTSATMQQGITDGAERLRDFASKLLSQRGERVIAISGQRILPERIEAEVRSPPPEASAVAQLNVDFPTLKDSVEKEPDGSEKQRTFLDDSDLSRELAQAALHVLRPDLEAKGTTPAARLLWEALEPLDWVRKLQAELHQERAVRIDAVAQKVFPSGRDDERRSATYKLLGLLAVARPTPSGLPLLPVRLHAIARGPHGVYACINPQCDRPSVQNRLGALYPDPIGRCSCGSIACELRVCEACGQSFLSADVGPDDTDMAALLPGCKTVDLFVPGDTWDDGTAIEGGQPLSVYVTGEGNGRIAPAGEGRALRRFPGGTLVGATRQLVGVRCPRCDASLPGRGILRRIEAGPNATLQVLVEGLYPQLPEYRTGDSEKTLRGGGRRALLFADNRQIAAALAAKIEEFHDVVLSRVILLDSLRNASETVTSPEIERLQGELIQSMLGKGRPFEQVAKDLQAMVNAGGNQGVDLKRLRRAVADHKQLRELSCFEADSADVIATMVVARELGRRPARTGNMEANGLVSVAYDLKVPRPSHPDVAAAFSAEAWRDLLGVMLDLLRTSGLVTLPDIAEPFDRYIVRQRNDKALVREAPRAGARDDEDEDEDDSDRAEIPLVPGPKSRSRRLEYVSKVLARLNAPPTIQPRLVLTQVWESLEAAAKAEGSCLKLEADKSKIKIRLPMLRLRFLPAEGKPAWCCPVCRTVWARQIALVCPTADCSGVLVPTEGAPLDSRDRLVTLDHGDFPMLGMSTEEHTAQIGTDELELFERKFKAGEINLLVCSTTMELGIDIGGLSATVLTNVPPSPSNYLQRAGRAGRRAEGTSLVLTFARPRPFDQAAFEEPDRPFNERIVPPQVQLDSRRIVQRHVNALLLAHFFRHYRVQTDAKDPMASLRSVGEFFDDPVSTILGGTAELKNLLADTGLAVAETTLSDAFVAWLELTAAEASEVAGPVAQLVAGTSMAADEPLQIAERAAAHIRRIGENVRTQLHILRMERGNEDEKPVDKQDRGRLDALTIQEEDLRGERLLGFLAEEQFLPRYGFPIQVVQLHDSYRYVKKVDRSAEGSGLRLARDIALALNEYAPGAEVVAGKHVHRSAGLVRHWTGTDAPGVFSSRFVAVCSQCGRLQHARSQGEVRSPCPTCKEGTPRTIQVILPKQGFAVKWGVRPRRWVSGMKPPMRPVTESAYAVRDGESVVEISPALAFGYDEEGQILVRTEGQLDPNELPGVDVRGAGAPARASVTQSATSAVAPSRKPRLDRIRRRVWTLCPRTLSTTSACGAACAVSRQASTGVTWHLRAPFAPRS
jgi:hypothetical protein